MKLFTVFIKSFTELRRDLLVLSLSLVFAPLFVFIYKSWLPSGSTTYDVLIINQDNPVTTPINLNIGQEIIQTLKTTTYKNEDPLFRVTQIEDRQAARIRLQNRDEDLLLLIPAGLSQMVATLKQGRPVEPASITFVGDLTSPQYMVAAVLTMGIVDQYLQSASGVNYPFKIIEEPLGASAARSEFELYVPGMLTLAVILLIFTFPIAIARDIESGTLRRLMLTQMSAWDYLGGMSLTFILLGAVQVVLTFFTAQLLGFHSQGPIWVAVLMGAITTFSVIGIGLIVACFSQTTTQALVIAQFPLALLMFFSGAIYPLPKVVLFTIGNRGFGLYDILPPTHTVVALNKVLTLGSGLNDVIFELLALIALSFVYFVIGVLLFKRTQMKPG